MSGRIASLASPLLVASLAACGAGATRPSATAPAEEQTPGPAATAQSEPQSAAPDELGPTTPEAPPPAAASAASGLDLDEWAYQHRMKVDLVADGCEPAELGSAPADVIWCGHHTEQSQIVVYTRALYAARQKRLVKLVELPVAVGLIDPAEGPRPESERYRVKLAITREADGKRVQVREASGYDCDRARQENEDDKVSQPALHKELAPALARVCSQRGTWSWTGGSLAHTGK